ncbi:MAG: gephyrin-like molybdotransferase Glp [Anaerolineales bacterium]
MLSVTEARRRLLSALPVCEAETVPLSKAGQRVLAEIVAASVDSPRFDNSSMDGFALRAADVEAASADRPVRLKVIGDLPAGAAFTGSVERGQAMRIMTGAAMPAGADVVAPVEDTDAPVAQAGAALPGAVEVRRSLKAGDYVRPAGEDFREGDVLLEEGSRLRAQDLALLAMLGRGEFMAYRKPRVAILSSGNELLTVGQTLSAGKIFETNSYALSALVESCGAEPVLLGIARDEMGDVKTHLERAVDSGADLILTSAGVSVGAFDYLREAVLSEGSLDFWKVNMRPGKPFAFGAYRQVPYIGLPGNPASAFVGFEVFVRPALQKMAGVRNWSRQALVGRLLESVTSDGRESYLRVRINRRNDVPEILLTGHQGSGNLYSLVRAEGLMVVPAGETLCSAGSQVEVWPL